jgi:hypothetical protein
MLHEVNPSHVSGFRSAGFSEFRPLRTRSGPATPSVVARERRSDGGPDCSRIMQAPSAIGRNIALLRELATVWVDTRAPLAPLDPHNGPSLTAYRSVGAGL